MPSPIGRVAGLPLSSEARRPRTTPKPVDTFQAVLRTGAQVLLAGASAASGLVGGPLLSTAIDAARAGIAQATGQGSPGQGQATSLTSGTAVAGSAGALGTSSGASTGTGSSASASTGSGTSEVEAMRQIQKEGQQQNLQYLQLQQEAQDQNRRFSLASSLLKARHDTARAAINNLRV